MEDKFKTDIIQATCAAFEGTDEKFKSGHGFRIRQGNKGVCAMYWGGNRPQHVLEVAINPAFADGEVIGWVEREILAKRRRGNRHWRGLPKGERPWPTLGFISVADAKDFLACYREVMTGERDAETLNVLAGRPTVKRLPRTYRPTVKRLTRTRRPAVRRLLRTRPAPAGDGPGEADALLARYHRRTAGLPDTTVAHRMVRQRIGQNLLRRALIGLWRGRCAVTGLTAVRLLRASHIKPWSESTDNERLNPANALLLAPQLDAAFDVGLITFEDDGRLRVSPVLGEEDLARLGLPGGSLSVAPSPLQRQFLAWHRHNRFKVR